ncbi:MAG: hypothetical protein J6Y82_05375 [Bacteroidales bacterium]|nr:hypothetical protein [Bacteroidales bacterium]
MKKIITILILLFSVFLSNAQIISIDSLYYTYNDTTLYKTKKRYYVKKLWMSFNYGHQRLLDRVIFDRSPKYNREEVSPKILKHIFNEYDSTIYRIDYYQESLSIRRIWLDGSSLIGSPYDWQTPEHRNWVNKNYIAVGAEIINYIVDKYLKLKDIDVSIDNNIMTLRCYKYQKQVVVFRYDLATEKSSIVEDRDLTEAEIDSLGFYKEDYDRAKIEGTTKRNKRRKNKNK